MPDDIQQKEQWRGARGCLLLIAMNGAFFVLLSCKLVGLWKISWHFVLLPIYIEMLAVLVVACCIHMQNFKDSIKDRSSDAKNQDNQT